MTHGERYVGALAFGNPDRFPHWFMYGLMPGVRERWVSEGMPESVQEGDIPSHFGFDPKPVGIPVNTGMVPAPVWKVIEDTDEYRIAVNDLGGKVMRTKWASTLDHALEYPVKTRDDWEAIKNRFTYSPDRFASDWLDYYHRTRERGMAIAAPGGGAYWFPRDLLGDLGLCLAYYEQPDLVHDIIDTRTELLLAIGEEILSKVEVDVVNFAEDMAHKHGSMISPKTFREFSTPHYRRIIDLYRSHGTRIFNVDTDGNVLGLIPLMLEAGITAMQPFEVQAGNDITQIRKQYGQKLAIIGGINKLSLLRDKNTIDRELEAKLPLMVETGGYIAGLDHRVVIETSYENFTYFVQRVSSPMSH